MNRMISTIHIVLNTVKYTHYYWSRCGDVVSTQAPVTQAYWWKCTEELPWAAVS